MDDGRIEVGRKCQRRGCGCKVAQWHSPGLLACIYCGAAQPLGPSNDHVPSDEMIVASIVASLEWEDRWHCELQGFTVDEVRDFAVGIGHHRDGIVAWTSMADVGATVRMAIYGVDDVKERDAVNIAHWIIEDTLV